MLSTVTCVLQRTTHFVNRSIRGAESFPCVRKKSARRFEQAQRLKPVAETLHPGIYRQAALVHTEAVPALRIDVQLRGLFRRLPIRYRVFALFPPPPSAHRRRRQRINSGGASADRPVPCAAAIDRRGKIQAAFGIMLHHHPHRDHASRREAQNADTVQRDTPARQRAGGRLSAPAVPSAAARETISSSRYSLPD